jgi:hypothetical protein
MFHIPGTWTGRVLKCEALTIRGNVCGAENTSLGDTGRVCIKFGIVSINGILWVLRML